MEASNTILSVGVIDDLGLSGQALAKRIEQHLESMRQESTEPDRENVSFKAKAYDLNDNPQVVLADIVGLGQPIGFVVDFWTEELPKGQTDHGRNCREFLEACENWSRFSEVLILVGSIHVRVQKHWLAQYKIKWDRNVVLLEAGRSPTVCAKLLYEWWVSGK